MSFEQVSETGKTKAHLQTHGSDKSSDEVAVAFKNHQEKFAAGGFLDSLSERLSNRSKLSDRKSPKTA